MGNRPKLAVIGASHFQLPLIQTAQRMGCEVHAFAWECGDIGETIADVFHPISIIETDAIVKECRRIGVQGICTIASDLATVAVCTVAHELGLVGNSLECMRVSTNKHAMREAFAAAGDPSPASVSIGENELSRLGSLVSSMSYPLIVKPTDRSGSRGVTKLDAPGMPMCLEDAVRRAIEQSFEKRAVVEEYAYGQEFSVEGMSWNGEHHVLTITQKETTGTPHFIETAHLQPTDLNESTRERIVAVTTHALDTLGVRYGASHTELKVADDGTIRLIEVGARMGGDCIGSHLVPLSTGIDFVRATVDVALGNKPDLTPEHEPAAAAIRFMFDEHDLAIFERLKAERPGLIRYSCMTAEPGEQEVLDSSTRLGHFVISAPHKDELLPWIYE